MHNGEACLAMEMTPYVRNIEVRLEQGQINSHVIHL